MGVLGMCLQDPRNPLQRNAAARNNGAGRGGARIVIFFPKMSYFHSMPTVSKFLDSRHIDTFARRFRRSRFAHDPHNSFSAA